MLSFNKDTKEHSLKKEAQSPWVQQMPSPSLQSDKHSLLHRSNAILRSADESHLKQMRNTGAISPCCEPTAVQNRFSDTCQSALVHVSSQ